MKPASGGMPFIRLPELPPAPPSRPGPMRDVVTNGRGLQPGLMHSAVQGPFRHHDTLGLHANQHFPVHQPATPPRAQTVIQHATPAPKQHTALGASNIAEPPAHEIATPPRAGRPSAPVTPATTGSAKRGRKQATDKPAPAKGRKGRSSGPSKGARRAKHGLGSKSGEGNRRERGTSDDEIEELSQAQRDAAALKQPEVEAEEEAMDEVEDESDESDEDEDEDESDEDEDDEDEEEDGTEVADKGKKKRRRRPRGLSESQKRKATEYITSPEVWSKHRLGMKTIATHIASVILGHTVTPKQVINFWNTAWDKYKACRTRAEHTGGGDGDADRDDDAARGHNKRRFSKATLDKFERSDIYRRIDNVAHDDESVVRLHDINSGEPVKEIGDRNRDKLGDATDPDEDEPRKKRRLHKSKSPDEDLSFDHTKALG
ncbi:hypothetical protein EVJ58_g8921, partial [Rhodofomes roseus]